MALTRKRLTIFFSLVLILCIGLRIAAAVTAPLSYDEAFSILISEKGPAKILTATLNMDEPSVTADIHPPTYYFLLDLWMRLFGNSVMAARALSLLLGIGILLNIFFLTKELLGAQVALLASLCVAALPFQVQFAVDARMYTLLTFWLTLATLSLIKAIRHPSWSWWILFGVSAAGAQYTHNLAVFYLLPLALTGFFMRNSKIARNTIFAGIGAVIIYIPWLIHIPAQFSKIQAHYWIEKPTLAAFVNLVLRYTTNIPLPKNWILPGLLVGFLCVAVAALQTIRAARQKIAGYKIGLWLAWCAFTPPLLLWLFSQWTPVYVDRALLASHALFCAWLVWALTSTSLPKAAQITSVLLIAFGICLGLSPLFTNFGYPHDALETIDSTLKARLQPGDVVIHSSKITYLPAYYFDANLPMNFVIDPPGGSNDTLSRSTRKVLGLHEAADISSAVGDSKEVWFIIYQESIDEYTTAGYTTHPHLQYLQENFTEVSKESCGDILLYRFELKSP